MARSLAVRVQSPLVYRNDGSGRFQAMSPVPFAGSSRSFGALAMPADVNDDTVVDFVVPHHHWGLDDRLATPDDWTTPVTCWHGDRHGNGDGCRQLHRHATLQGNGTRGDNVQRPLELRTRIAAPRAREGLPPVRWTDRVLTVEVTPVKRVHLIELRTALDETYDAAERPRPTYTDSIVTAGMTTIKTVHVVELREATLALE